MDCESLQQSCLQIHVNIANTTQRNETFSISRIHFLVSILSAAQSLLLLPPVSLLCPDIICHIVFLRTQLFLFLDRKDMKYSRHQHETKRCSSDSPSVKATISTCIIFCFESLRVPFGSIFPRLSS